MHWIDSKRNYNIVGVAVISRQTHLYPLLPSLSLASVWQMWCNQSSRVNNPVSGGAGYEKRGFVFLETFSCDLMVSLSSKWLSHSWHYLILGFSFHHGPWWFQSVRSVAQLCLTLCNPMDCSMLGFPVYHHILEFVQSHVHWVGDAIQPSDHLLSPSPLAFNLSQH